VLSGHRPLTMKPYRDPPDCRGDTSTDGCRAELMTTSRLVELL
jgi:hypothetical protein